MIDLQRMQEIADTLYVPLVEKVHGNKGILALRQLLQFIPAFYRYVVPDNWGHRIVIVKSLNDTIAPSFAAAAQYLSVQHLPSLGNAPISIQIFTAGHLLLSQTLLDPGNVGQDVVIYTFENRVERFYVGTESAQIKNPGIGYASIFATPTFDDLRIALEEYQKKQARKCSCKILLGSWNDEKRLFFRKKPETIMRDSLTQFLKICLRGDVEVRPEQVVDESHPVDIKITWFGSNRLGLVEIKWIGASKTSATKLVRHSDQRARKGAKQLADYLDANIVQAPGHVSRGYLERVS